MHNSMRTGCSHTIRHRLYRRQVTTPANSDTLRSFHSGRIGIEVGNQQFTVRNLTVKNAVTGKKSCNRDKSALTTHYSAVSGIWDWGPSLYCASMDASRLSNSSCRFHIPRNNDR